MNIDLLLTRQFEAGLISDGPLTDDPAGAMFEGATGIITLEFGTNEPMELNIPVEQGIAERLKLCLDIHIGIIHNDVVTETRQIPLILSDDPFGGGNAGRFAVKPRQSVTAFQRFMKQCNTGQPVHRDDLENEASASAVIGGLNPAILQLAPHLSRQQTLEAAPKAAPRMGGPSGPRAPGPLTPGGMSSGAPLRSDGSAYKPPQNPRGKPSDRDED